MITTDCSYELQISKVINILALFTYIIAFVIYLFILGLILSKIYMDVLEKTQMELTE